MKSKLAIFIGVLVLGSINLVYGSSFITTVRTIRITDAIGRGKTIEEARKNAIKDAKEKAKRRVTSAFSYLFVRVKNASIEKMNLSEKLHAEVIGEPRIIKEEKPFKDVVILDCIVKVKFLDLDFFVEEAKKTAEGACIRSLVLAGWGQAYNRNYFAGFINFLLTYGSLVYGINLNTKYQSAYSEYRKTNDTNQLIKAEKYQKTRDTFYANPLISWLYSVWDAFEDRKRASEVLDKIHNKYFKEIPYKTTDSFLQEFMYDTIPSW